MARTARARELLAAFGLSGRESHRPGQLSGGEQQRVAIARALAQSPAVILADEPTASLDPGATRAVEEIIDAFHRAGTKIVMTTHDLGQARRLADEIAFLHRGRLAEHAPAAEFFAGPRSPEAEAYLAGRLLW